MGKQWVNGYYRNRRRTRSRSTSGGGCILFFLIIPLALIFLLYLTITLIQTYPQIFLILLLVIIFLVAIKIRGYFVKRHRKREEQARQQHMQQVQAHQQLVYQAQVQYQQEQAKQERLNRLQTLGGFFTLTPSEFEEIIGHVLASYGLQNIQRVGGSGDLGVDLIGIDPSGQRVIIQCKRYAAGRPIGTPDLQKFIGMMVVQHKAQKGIFVTTSTFKQTAKDLAHQSNIVLIDGDMLVRLVQRMAPQQHM